MGGYVPPLPVLPGKPKTRKQVKRPWASQRDVHSLHTPTTLRWDSRAGAENSSPDGAREQMAKTSAGPGWSHAEHLGGSGAMWAAKLPAPAEALLQPWIVLGGFLRLSFSHLHNVDSARKTLLTRLTCESSETAVSVKDLE